MTKHAQCQLIAHPNRQPNVWVCTQCEGIITHSNDPQRIHKQCPGQPPTQPTNPPPQRRPTTRYITTTDLVLATQTLIEKLPPRINAVAGIARSGLIPAAQIAAALHCELFALNAFGDPPQLRATGAGFRLPTRNQPIDTLLIVDDTAASHDTMHRAVTLLHHKHAPAEPERTLTAAVFATSKAAQQLDYYAEILPLPHYLQWNLWNCPYMRHIAVDFDGILCPDPPTAFDREPDQYARWILNTPPLNIPRRAPLPAIITARPETTRGPTEAWLARWQISTKLLEMWPHEPPSTRWSTRNAVADWKAAIINRLQLCGYVESCPEQAAQLRRTTRIQIICPEDGTAY